MVQHDTTTTAEAYNLTIRFFIPPFVSIENGSINLSSNLTHSSAVSMLTYSVIYFHLFYSEFKRKLWTLDKCFIFWSSTRGFI